MAGVALWVKQLVTSFPSSSCSLWKSALRVVAGLAPLALLVAAIQPNVLIVDPRV